VSDFNIIPMPVSRAPDGSLPPLRARPAIDLERAARATRDAGMQSYFAERGVRHVVVREPWWERVAEALGSERFFLFYLGFYAGCFATVALAFVWSVA
jgi:hypothetical protein